MADSRESIRLLESRRYRAMCEADAQTLEQLLGDSLIYTHSYGGADTKASYLDGISSKKVVKIELLSEGKPKTLNSRFTNVWVKGAKGWQMAAWQSTPLPA